MSDIRRIVVTTAAGALADLARAGFLVHRNVRPAFVDQMVKDIFGAQESGEPHEWEAHEVREAAGQVGAGVI